MCNSHKYFRNLCLTFWIMNIQFCLEHILFKIISGKKLAKIYVDQDPNPDVFESLIRSKIVQIRISGTY
jgi:hypothetical protein